MKQGTGQKREHTKLPDGRVMVRVTPPSYIGLPTQQVLLSSGQYTRYSEWLDGRGLIQDLLYDLTDDQREILITGIGGDDFDRMFPEEG